MFPATIFIQGSCATISFYDTSSFVVTGVARTTNVHFQTPKSSQWSCVFFMTELLLLFYGILGFGEGLRKFWLLSISINYTHAAVNYHNPFRCLKVDSWNILSSCMLLGLFPTKVVHFWEMFSCYIYQRK